MSLDCFGDTYYENKRQEYLDILRYRSSQDLSVLMVENNLKSMSVDEIKPFIDEIESKVDEFANDGQYYTTDRRGILDYLLFPYLKNTTFTGNNLLTSQKISVAQNMRNSNNPKYKDLQKSLKTLSFLLNQIILHDSGMAQQNIGFDGYHFFDLQTNNPVHKISNSLQKSNLSHADRLTQSNFVLNEDFAQALLHTRKKHKQIQNKDAVIYNTVENGCNIMVFKTLFKPANENLGSDLSLGYFVKTKKINLDNNSFEIILYYYADEELKNGIQLFRVDKVPATFKGMPASHILKGGEKISSTLHSHVCNIIDSVIKNPDKEDSLGAMDISHNMLNANDVSVEIAEEFFNQFCGMANISLEEKNKNTLYNKLDPQHSIF